jgi:predicted anti-sigma-YlaC factor YlaD
MCPEFEILSAYFDGEIGSPWAKHIEEHCSSCVECRSKLDSLGELRQMLKKDEEPDVAVSYARVKEKMDSYSLVRSSAQKPIWKQSIAIPIPAFALSLVFICAVIVLIFANQSKNNINTATAKTKESVATELQIVGPSSEEVETLLKQLEKMGTPQEVVIKLPEGSHVKKVGEPALLRSVDFRRDNR